jgi:hypothetical protein
MGKVFKTKTGFCHITEEKIILTRDGVMGTIASMEVGNNIPKLLITYGLTSLWLMYCAYNSYLNGDTFEVVIFGLFGLCLVYVIAKSLNNSATPIIDRKDIKTVKFIKGISGLTRSRFEVEFNQKGKIKKRLILLPGSLTDGQNETEKAIKIMTDEKLLN